MSDPIEVAYNIDAEGAIENLRIWETDPGRQTNIIQTGINWGVVVEWEMSGQDLLFPIPPAWANTEWRLQLFLESYGTHAEYTFPDIPAGDPLIVEPWGAGADPKNWAHTITIPAAKLINPGPYRLALMLQLYDTVGNAPLNITGFVEGPSVLFY
jgi:hypothetical protein